MEELVIGLAPQITSQTMIGWAENIFYLSDNQVFALGSVGIKIIAAILLTLTFHSCKKGIGKPNENPE